MSEYYILVSLNFKDDYECGNCDWASIESATLHLSYESASQAKHDAIIKRIEEHIRTSQVDLDEDEFKEEFGKYIDDDGTLRSELVEDDFYGLWAQIRRGVYVPRTFSYEIQGASPEDES